MRKDEVWAVALFDYDANEAENVLSVRAGEFVIVTPRPDQDWWPAKTRNDSVGFLPKNYLELQEKGWTPNQLGLAGGSVGDANEDAADSAGDDVSDEVQSGSEGLSDSSESEVESILVEALYDFVPKDASHLGFEKGQKLLVEPLRDDWLNACLPDDPNIQGIIPANYVRAIQVGDEDDEASEDYENDDEFDMDFTKPRARSHSIKAYNLMAICQYDFVKRDENELSFKKGSFLWVVRESPDWWRAQNEQGATGLVPRNYIKLIEDPTTTSVNSNLVPDDMRSKLNLDALQNWAVFKYLFDKCSIPAIMFSNLIHDQNLFRQIRVRPGEKIDHTSFYIVINGEIELRTVSLRGSTPSKREWSTISYFTHSQWFGESFVSGERPTMDNIEFYSRTSATLLQMTLKSYKVLEEKFPETFCSNMQRLADRRTATFARNSFETLVSTLDDKYLAVMSMCFKYQGFDPGQFLYRVGDKSLTIYTIIAGKALITTEGNKVLGPGISFGTQCFYSDDLRRAAVRTADEATLETLVLSKEDYVRFKDILPLDVLHKLEEHLRRFGDSFKKIALFEGLPKSLVEELLYVCTCTSIAQPSDGADLKRALDNFDEQFIFVAEGEVEVRTLNGEVHTYRANEYFGEVSLIRDEPYASTAKITKFPCIYFNMHRGGFTTVLQEYPKYKRRLISEIERVARSERSRRPSLFKYRTNRDIKVPYSDTVEALAGFKRNETDDYLKVAENSAALATWTELGHALAPCHQVFDAWPFYVYYPSESHLMTQSNQELYINIVGLGVTLNKMTMRVSLDDTVAAIVARVFEIVSRKSGQTIDVRGPEAFTFKVKSRNDFFVFRDIPIRRYKYISRAAKLRSNIYLALVDLRYRPKSDGSGVYASKFHTDLSNVDPALEEPDSDCDEEDNLLGLPPFSLEDLASTMIETTEQALGVRYVWEEPHGMSRIATVNMTDTIFRFKLVGIEGNFLDMFKSVDLTERNEHDFRIHVEVVYANQAVHETATGLFKVSGDNALNVQRRLNEWICFDCNLDKLPLTTRLCFTLYDYSCSKPSRSVSASTSNDVALAFSMPMLQENRGCAVAGAAIQIFDHRHELLSGRHPLVWWPNEEADRALFCANMHDKVHSRDQMTLWVEFEEYICPVFYELPAPRFPRSPSKDKMRGTGSQTTDGLSKDEVQRVTEAIDRFLLSKDARYFSLEVVPRHTREDPKGLDHKVKSIVTRDATRIYAMSDDERKAVWSSRSRLESCGWALPAVMLSVDWLDPSAREEALAYLERCVPPRPLQAMELLDCCQGDYRVREYAVRCLEQFSDSELEEYLLQLVQVVKYEAYHDSPLARFLLRRAWQNPREIGTKFFWHLRSEMHHQKFSIRYGVLLLKYLSHSSKRHLADLTAQSDILKNLNIVADAVVKKPKGSQGRNRRDILISELGKLENPPAYQLPFDAKIVVRKIIAHECKVMNSKKKPLWLKFRSVDCEDGGGTPYLAMFKSGDDLRQDQMTLQLLRIMSQLWLDYGLDMRMSIYECITTGNECGMIEIVTNADTTANIQKAYGRIGALRSATLTTWLNEVNSNNLHSMRTNFMYSCAGYCVATYVMGIGDRHSDNIMLARDGKLFHIDFGHFLGHFKSKAGFKRERSPFVFTKEMAHVLGGKGSKFYLCFVEICCICYNILRWHAHDLINLFRLMLPADIPELQSDHDIQYLCRKLLLGKSDEQAAASFRKEINICLSDTYRRFDNLIHNTKTG